LSKLEDKVVPRSESSKPGRFARAMAAAEESGRGGRDEATDADSGWKSRIGFPKKKTEPEEKVAGEVSTSSSAEKVSDKSKNRDEETRQEAGKAVEAGRGEASRGEASLDVAALAPAGLPKDVTPEEVAAIAAAAAQMQMVASAIRQEHPAFGPGNTDRTESNLASAAEVSRDAAPVVTTEAKLEIPAENKREETKPNDTAGEPAAVETFRRRKGDVSPEVRTPEVPTPEVRIQEAQDVPVTMAATAESVVAANVGGSRWTAVSVALEGSESAISLDQEMQKAYAAVAGAGSSSVAAIPQPASGPAITEASTTISNPAPGSVLEPQPARNVASVEAEPVSVAQSEPAAVAPSVEPAVPTPIAAVIAPVEASAEASTSAASAESKQDESKPEPSHISEPVANGALELQQSAIAGPVDVSRTDRAVENPAAETVPEPKLDSETVKNTAAAWANWRQVHDSSQGNEVAETQAQEKEKAKEKEVDHRESAPPDTAARAVAAGAEQLLQEAAAAAQDGDQSNVASIVDSVLADLRPKLMEEINRKMSKKK
jgi:hypothetical protein